MLVDKGVNSFTTDQTNPCPRCGEPVSYKLCLYECPWCRLQLTYISVPDENGQTVRIDVGERHD